MYTRISAGVLAAVLLSGCTTLAPQKQAVRPVLTCDDCSGLAYYGPQQAPAPDPRVQLADSFIKGVTGVVGLTAGLSAAKSMTNTVANAGRIEVVEQQPPLPPTVVRPEVILIPEGSQAITTE